MNNKTKITVNDCKVICHGKPNEKEHPAVYLALSLKNNEVTCPYCGKCFVYENKKI
ncbi:MAG: putative Zn-finger protein [Candidatus Midichloriaceae bacterium]|jgi:uncharacterized Zn-finger protein